MMKKIVCAVAMVLLSMSLVAQSKQERFQKEIQTVGQLLQQGKYRESLPFLERLNEFRPNTYSAIYNLAACYAVTGNTAEAFRWLQYLISIDAHPQFDTDSDFVSLKPNTAYSALLSRRNELDKMISHSSDVVSFSDSLFHPENAVFNSKTKLWYAGSIRNGSIYEFDASGNLTTKRFKFPSQAYSVFCVTLSPDGKYLFASASVSPYQKKPNTPGNQLSALLIYETATGKLEREIILKGDHVLGDMTSDERGKIYLSDSNLPVIYEFDQRNDSLKEFISLPDAWNLQGLTFSDDFQFLFVADYISGIYRIDMKTKLISLIKNETQISLKGIDGLRYYRNSLIAIQNGVRPKRIVRLQLNNFSDSIISTQTIEQNNDELQEPTNGFISDDQFFYLSNSPWNAYDRTFHFDETLTKRPLIKKFKLK